MDGNEHGGMIHQIAVAPLHTAGGVLLLHHGFIITAAEEVLIPLPVLPAPSLRLPRIRDHRLQRHIPADPAQLQHSLAKPEITPPGHAAQIMPKALLIRSQHQLKQSFLQQDAAHVRFIVTPGQFLRPVAGEAAAHLSGPHGYHFLCASIIEHLFGFVKNYF